MYLKQVTINGFKSFADKMELPLTPVITCIVGTNGCGKSNIVDAIRWVLGEQSAKSLRGSKMEDVIFTGTQARRQQGFAEVSLIVDNSDKQLAIDYNEVVITRRVFRSGESEYLINGAVCRLRDVNELFYDTGIGKEGYSIIGQGQIDKILSGKPEERRELFDEAAGIVKFKRRKNAAQTKLENEKQNLIRVNDILSELEKQVGPLEKQSEVAKIYLKKKEGSKGGSILANEKKKQFSLSLMMRILLGVLVVVSIGIFAGSVMRYNALIEEQKALEAQLQKYEELKEELQELLNSDMDRDYIIKIAKEQMGLYFPDEELFINDRNE